MLNLLFSSEENKSPHGKAAWVKSVLTERLIQTGHHVPPCDQLGWIGHCVVHTLPVCGLAVNNRAMWWANSRSFVCTSGRSSDRCCSVRLLLWEGWHSPRFTHASLFPVFECEWSDRCCYHPCHCQEWNYLSWCETSFTRAVIYTFIFRLQEFREIHMFLFTVLRTDGVVISPPKSYISCHEVVSSWCCLCLVVFALCSFSNH